MKGAFSHPHFFREIRLDHPIIFSLMELGLEVELKVYVYRRSIDLVILCFPTLLSSWIIDGDSLVTFVAISQWIPL